MLAVGALERHLAALLEPSDGRLDRLSVLVGEVVEAWVVRVEDHASGRIVGPAGDADAGVLSAVDMPRA